MFENMLNFDDVKRECLEGAPVELTSEERARAQADAYFSYMVEGFVGAFSNIAQLQAFFEECSLVTGFIMNGLTRDERAFFMDHVNARMTKEGVQ